MCNIFYLQPITEIVTEGNPDCPSHPCPVPGCILPDCPRSKWLTEVPLHWSHVTLRQATSHNVTSYNENLTLDSYSIFLLRKGKRKHNMRFGSKYCTSLNPYLKHIEIRSTNFTANVKSHNSEIVVKHDVAKNKLFDIFREWQFVDSINLFCPFCPICKKDCKGPNEKRWKSKGICFIQD